ncbi:MAG: hypothetical protein HYV60_00140 [Planctomycetia bacterium]|nr:hypothetical protein [Planctomycetia bacterium]
MAKLNVTVLLFVVAGTAASIADEPFAIGTRKMPPLEGMKDADDDVSDPILPAGLLTLPARSSRDNNAIDVALKMAQLYEPLSRRGSLLELRRDDPVEQTLSSLTSVRESQHKEELLVFVDDHQELLDAYGRFLRIGSIQFSTLNGWGSSDNAFRRVFRVGCIRARFLISEGRSADAIGIYGELLAGTQILREAARYSFLTGVSQQAMIIGCIARAAIGESIPVEELQRLLELVQNQPLPTSQVDLALHSQFEGDFVTTLRALLSHEEWTAVVESLLNEWRPSKNVELLRHVETEHRKRTQMIREMFAGHPAPFSNTKTIQKLGDLVRELQDNSKRVWHLQDTTVQRELAEVVAAWPEALSLMPLDLIGISMGHEQEMLGDATLAAARERLKSIDNPFGKYMLATCDVSMFYRSLFTYSAELQLRKTAIAIEFYRTRHDKVPAGLDLLVQSKIIPALPDDPFGESIRYSADQLKLWSVGENGQDEGGNRDYDPNGTLRFFRAVRPPGGREPPASKSITQPLRDDIAYELRPVSNSQSQ